MCGRFTLITSPSELVRRFGLLPTALALEPRYNLAPGQTAPIIYEASGRQLTLMTWGFVPQWMKEMPVQRPINARCEGIQTKPMFRDAVASHRCLIPADGFYEWVEKTDGTGKTPFHFTRPDKALFSMAGIWNQWLNPKTQEKTPTFAIITTPASPSVLPYHHRMPAILSPEAESIWLTGAVPKALEVLAPYPIDLQCYQVSSKVNSSRYDSRDCIDPI